MSVLVKNYISGGLSEPEYSSFRVNLNPATGAVIGHVASSSESDLQRALDSAVSASHDWSRIGIKARAEILRAWGQSIRGRVNDIALADTLDSGTPIRTMRAGVLKGLTYLEYFCGLWSEIKGTTVPASADALHYTVREPIGVVGVIIPFNHPAFFSISKVVPALLAGNTVVVKPSELTPTSASMIAECGSGILPAGVLNVVHGGAELGAALVTDARTSRIHFTGGVSTGLRIQELAAKSGTVKNVSLELGGKNPIIIFPDADPVFAAKQAVAGMNFTRNQGQSCGSTSRLIVHSAVANKVIDEVIKQMRLIELGLPELEETEMGSLISDEQRQRIYGTITAAVREGAVLEAGDEVIPAELSSGAYMRPTLLTNLPPDSTVAQTELFGPVLAAFEWSNSDEAVRLANNSRFGLTAAIITGALEDALWCVDNLDAGYIWVNGVEERWVGTPFGGFKNSGTSSEHDIGEILSYTRTKAVNIVRRRRVAEGIQLF